MQRPKDEGPSVLLQRSLTGLPEWANTVMGGVWLPLDSIYYCLGDGPLWACLWGFILIELSDIGRSILINYGLLGAQMGLSKISH